MTEEQHPLKPFLPEGATRLFLGSFPPPQNKWSMHFFYPNWINDFWRIMGLIEYGDKTTFEVKGEKRFDQQKIEDFARKRHIAMYDTAERVCRLDDNASDDRLEILTPTDVAALVRALPHCRAIITTGGKASEQIRMQFALDKVPKIGTYITIRIDNREIRWWRMPSSSRAYPMSIDRKAEFYRAMMADEQ